MNPWLADSDVTLYHGNALDVLAALPAGVAQTCVTSPPYWGLRDYGTGSWTGGAADCDHLRPAAHGYDPFTTSTLGPKRDGVAADNSAHADAVKRQQYAGECGKCGARRVDSQIGLEATPGGYVASIVAVLEQVWRVLRDDGTLWLNLGDSYASGSSGESSLAAWSADNARGGAHQDADQRQRRAPAAGLKPKDLVGIPWRVAFALQDAGWYLRSDIVWSKPNPMPESVTDRPTKAHEYVFLFAKQPRYYYDADAVREPHTTALPVVDKSTRSRDRHTYDQALDRRAADAYGSIGYGAGGRNLRSVWQIATQPTPEAHFATYPEALVERCIKAGTSEHGECSVCGAPWQRITERTPSIEGRDNWAGHQASKNGASRKGGVYDAKCETTGWAPTCWCGVENDDGYFVPPPTRQQTVLDPFVGSGTTALVARKHGRKCIGIDLNAEYLAIAARRTAQQSLLA